MKLEYGKFFLYRLAISGSFIFGKLCPTMPNYANLPARSPIYCSCKIPNLPARSPICPPDPQAARQIPNIPARSPIYLPNPQFA